MQTPKRKPGKFTFSKPDPYLTLKKFNQLKKQLEKLKLLLPDLKSEVKQLASDGDFSENAAYQIAKGKLRGINQKILNIENHLKTAIIIDEPKSFNFVKIGCSVELIFNKKHKIYKILGPSEVDIEKNIISYKSPIGKILLDKRPGDIIQTEINNKTIDIEIIKIF